MDTGRGATTASIFPASLRAGMTTETVFSRTAPRGFGGGYKHSEAESRKKRREQAMEALIEQRCQRGVENAGLN